MGFACAAGDAALVATVHHLVVLPDLRGLGLGRNILRKLCMQVSNTGYARACTVRLFFPKS